MDRKKYRYWFTVNQKPLFLISIPISQLNQGEVDFLIESKKKSTIIKPYKFIPTVGWGTVIFKLKVS